MITKLKKISKILIIILIICLFIWFLLIKPKYTFHTYEKDLENAAKRYYEINPDKLPTGKRTATIKMIDLFQQAYLTEDMFIPYSKKACSSTNSWVKVRKDSNSKYKYYVYLECGVLKSNIDHEGPMIKLNGKQEEEIEINSKYEDPGIESVIDKVDGEIDIKDVVVDGEVDTSKVGTYKIKYTAYDSLNNKTTITRTITVTKTAYSEIKKSLGKENRFKGDPENNYINISKMDFRIVGVDDNKNVIVVSEDSISFVNGNKIDDWLNNYYYELLSNKTKKMIVESKYCNKVSDTTSSKCSGFTDNKKIYIPSISDVNKAANGEDNFMINYNYTWLAEKKDNNRYTINEYDLLESYDNKSIQAIRPIFIIKGTEKIIDGKGTKNDPYLLKDYEKLKADSKVSNMQIGDYIDDDDTIWRVVNIEKNGDVKVISKDFANKNGGLKIINMQMGKKTYNPKNKKSIAYAINNKSLKYFNTKILTKHDIEVPIYKDQIVYGTETENKKYNVLVSAPNVFEIFSASDEYNSYSCWFINSSKKSDVATLSDADKKIQTKIYSGTAGNVRVVGYISNDKKIGYGNGLRSNPYTVG